MGVEGLTRENVASHLQKYRLQLRKEGKETDVHNGAEEEDTHQNAVNVLADAIASRRNGVGSDSAGEPFAFCRAATLLMVSIKVLDKSWQQDGLLDGH